mgnify:FL=1|tara:strand:+ start:478 stop:738 length:261 start_codon:yes stop_codon:yes gene_type:complete
MNIEEKKDYIAQYNPEALLADGFEDALIGLGQQFNKTLAVYDRQKCIEILIDRDGMSEEEAVEYFEFNVTNAWVGENTPIFFEKAW